MANSNTVFDEIDVNRDGRVSRAEFKDFLKRTSVAGAGTSNYSVGNDFNNLETGVGGGYGASSFQLSSYDTSINGGALGAADLAYSGAGYGSSLYDSSSFRSSVGNIGSDFTNLNVSGAARASNLDAVSTDYSSTSRVSSVQHYETDEQGNFKDANPQVVRRPAQNGPITYTQNIKVRFLQPPAVPPPGPLIIKEVRPPQPPAPQPLRVRQQAPPIPQQPPLVLRERPPPVPAAVASQTTIRNLAAIAVPPRSVVIERLPAAPPKPRDVLIERWIPYGAMAERKTIVQRAEAAIVYPQPRNFIVQYEAPQVRVVRQFQRLNITQENPQEYIQRYGASLYDTQTLLQHARAAGVVEDISPPAPTNSFTSSASEFSSASHSGAIGFESGNTGAIDVGAIAGGGDGRSSFYEPSSYSVNGDISGFGAGFRGTGSSLYESSAYRSSVGGSPRGVDALFAAVDTNNDGVVTREEFENAGL